MENFKVDYIATFPRGLFDRVMQSFCPLCFLVCLFSDIFTWKQCCKINLAIFIHSFFYLEWLHKNIYTFFLIWRKCITIKNSYLGGSPIILSFLLLNLLMLSLLSSQRNLTTAYTNPPSSRLHYPTSLVKKGNDVLSVQRWVEGKVLTHSEEKTFPSLNNGLMFLVLLSKAEKRIVSGKGIVCQQVVSTTCLNISNSHPVCSTVCWVLFHKLLHIWVIIKYYCSKEWISHSFSRWCFSTTKQGIHWFN